MGIFGLNPHALQVRTQWLQAIRRIPRIRRDLPPRLAGAEAVRSSCREGGKMAGLIGWWSPVTLLNCFIYIYVYICIEMPIDWCIPMSCCAWSPDDSSEVATASGPRPRKKKEIMGAQKNLKKTLKLLWSYLARETSMIAKGKESQLSSWNAIGFFSQHPES
jgi:hypothetical protein